MSFVMCFMQTPEMAARVFCGFMRVLSGAWRLLFGFVNLELYAMLQHIKHQKPKPKVCETCACNLETDLGLSCFLELGLHVLGFPCLVKLPLLNTDKGQIWHSSLILFASCSGPFVFRAWFGLGDSVFGVLLLEGLGGIVLYVVRGLGRLCHRKENMVSLLW